MIDQSTDIGILINDGQNSTDSALAPRRVTHPKERITIVWLIRKTVSPLQPAPRPDRKVSPVPRHPEQIVTTTRYGARRRAIRLRMAFRLRVIKVTKRIGYTCLVAIIVMMFSFWAKFAVVYNIPTDLQTGSLQHVQGYIVFKSWWFGPPVFNLRKYTNIDPLNPDASLATDLQNYRDIITNPSEIVWTWP